MDHRGRARGSQNEKIRDASDTRMKQMERRLSTLAVLALVLPASGRYAAFAGCPPEAQQSAVAAARNSVVSVETFSRAGGRGWIRVGSGFLYGTGIVITRNSVIQGADSIAVMLADGRTASVELAASDSLTQVAFLRHRIDGVRPLQFHSASSLPEGLPLTILGNSLGVFPSVTLSRFKRKTHDGFLEIDARIPPGNCGSPVLDASGGVVGMIIGTAHAEEDKTGPVGIALPSESIRRVLDRITSAEKGGWIGISVLDLPGIDGLRVVDVVRGGPAEAASIGVGDTLIRVSGKGPGNALELADRIRKSAPDTKLNLTVRNNGVETVRTVKVARSRNALR
jgi:S1-C subfamily serine protease